MYKTKQALSNQASLVMVFTIVTGKQIRTGIDGFYLTENSTDYGINLPGDMDLLV